MCNTRMVSLFWRSGEVCASNFSCYRAYAVSRKHYYLAAVLLVPLQGVWDHVTLSGNPEIVVTRLVILSGRPSSVYGLTVQFWDVWWKGLFQWQPRRAVWSDRIKPGRQQQPRPQDGQAVFIRGGRWLSRSAGLLTEKVNFTVKNAQTDTTEGLGL